MLTIEIKTILFVIAGFYLGFMRWVPIESTFWENFTLPMIGIGVVLFFVIPTKNPPDDKNSPPDDKNSPPDE